MNFDAFIFDLNGTMINDMAFHEKAWFDMLNEELKANMTMAEVKSHMYGKNEELFERVFGKDTYSVEQVADFSLRKEQRYQKDFLPHLQLIDGLNDFLSKASSEGIRMAIGTAASPFNVNYVLDNIDIRSHFGAVVTADDVPVSKPNPDVFLRCAELLKVQANACVVFEDSPKGAEAARNAGMKAVVIKTYHEEQDFSHLNNILFFVDDYRDERLKGLFRQD
jgi:beta-phosphoglucomutase